MCTHFLRAIHMPSVCDLVCFSAAAVVLVRIRLPSPNSFPSVLVVVAVVLVTVRLVLGGCSSVVPLGKVASPLLLPVWKVHGLPKPPPGQSETSGSN